MASNKTIVQNRARAKKISILAVAVPAVFFIALKIAGIVYPPLRVGGKNPEVADGYAVRANAAADNDYAHYALKIGSGCGRHYPLGAPRVQGDDKAALLCYGGFALHYDAQTKTPLWGSYVLDAAEWRQPEKRTAAAWAADPNLAQKAKSITVFPQMYAQLGMAAAQLVPAADLPNQEGVQQSMWMSNAVPQTAAAGQLWGRLNQAIHSLVGKKKGGAALERLYVVSGAVYKPIKGQKPPKAGEPPYYTFAGIQTPTYFYKAVLHPKSGRSIAFLVPNTEDASLAAADFRRKGIAMSIAELEKEAKVVLFPNISEPAAKRNTALLEWF